MRQEECMNTLSLSKSPMRHYCRLLPIWVVAISVVFSSFWIAGCTQGKSQKTETHFRVGLVADKGGVDDHSFNAAALQGLKQAEKELHVSTKFVEATDDNSFETLIRSFAQRKFDLILLIGFSQADPLKRIAPQFKDQHFVILDGVVDLPNVKSLIFSEQEGSFLVGALAAITSKTSKVGFIGGMDVPIIRRFEMGYKAGAQYAKPQIKVFSNYIGITGDAWNNPAKAKELAVTQYNQGSDVIFSAAGASVVGVFDAAEENKKFAIGVDLNQNWVKPGFVLTSMVKRIDRAVFQSIKEAKEGKFISGTQNFGVVDQGVDYVIDKHNEALISAETKTRLEQMKSDIISGKIKVPDYYKMRQ